MIDYSILNTLKDDLGEEILKQALALVTQELTTAEAIFNDLLTSKDYHSFNRKAHSLKGSSMSFGFIDLKEICFSLEKASHDPVAIDLDFITQQLEAFKQERDSVLKELQAL